MRGPPSGCRRGSNGRSSNRSKPRVSMSPFHRHPNCASDESRSARRGPLVRRHSTSLERDRQLPDVDRSGIERAMAEYVQVGSPNRVERGSLAPKRTNQSGMSRSRRTRQLRRRGGLGTPSTADTIGRRNASTCRLALSFKAGWCRVVATRAGYCGCRSEYSSDRTFASGRRAAGSCPRRRRARLRLCRWTSS